MIEVKIGLLLILKQDDQGGFLGRVLGKIFSAPKITGTYWLPLFSNPESGLHVFDDRVTKL